MRKNEGMYVLCTIQPELEETKVEGYKGEWLTLEGKREAIDNFYKMEHNIPISVTHKTAKVYGSFIANNDRGGKVLDLFTDKDGDLVAKCILYKDSDAFKTINQGFHLNKERWGVSLRIDWCIPGGYGGDGRIEKKITHIALTKTPFLADKGSFIHHWSTNEKAIDRAIHKEYYNENDGLCYASNELKNKIANAVNSHSYHNPIQNSREHSTNTFLMDTNTNNINTESNNASINASESSNQQQQQQLKQESMNPSGSESNQQQQRSTQQQQQTQQVSNNEGSRSTSEFTGLADMEQDLLEMKAMLVDVPLQDMPDSFIDKYRNATKQIALRKKDMVDHVNFLIDKKRLKREDASTYLNVIESTDKNIDLKRPVFGFVEASLESHKYGEEENKKKFKILEDNNKRYAEERNQALLDLEGMKKKIKTNDYASFGGSSNNNSSVLNQQQQQPTTKSISFNDPFGNTHNNNNSSDSGFSLLDYLNKNSNDKIVRREAINLHVSSQYDNGIGLPVASNVGEKGFGAFNKLLDAVKLYQ